MFYWYSKFFYIVPSFVIVTSVILCSTTLLLQVCSCLGDDDFILVLQTPLQAMMLRKYGPHQCICMDITKGDQSAKSRRIYSCVGNFLVLVTFDLSLC